MSLRDLTDRVHAIGNAWEQFKQVNDSRLSDLERKGHADPLYLEHLAKISQHLDQQKSRLDRIETAQARPGVELAGSPISGEAACEYKAAFLTYLRKGMDAGLEAFATKALSVGTAADGGYLVTPQMSEEIVRIVTEISPLRELASVETISSDSLDVIEDTQLPSAAWVAETAARTDTNTQQINKNNIITHEMYAIPKATQKLIDDSAVDVEAWLAQKVAEKFAALEATAFVAGTGTGQPKGILTYTAGTNFGEIEQIVSGTSAVVTADGLVKLYYALKDEYAKNATYLINRSVIQAIRLLKEATTGQYLWQPGLAAGTPDTLLGVPVKAAADMPVAAANSLSVAVADFRRAYKIVDRIGIRTLRDPYTDKPYVKFYTTRRVGGEVVNTEAIKILKLSA